MENDFCVTIGGNPVGKVTVRRLGLYYQFSCRCDLSDDILYRLTLMCKSGRINLGILVPENGSFVLNTKVPLKKIGEGDMTFSLVSKQEQRQGSFVPIYPEEPFAYLSRLKASFLVYENGIPGIHIAKSQE